MNNNNTIKQNISVDSRTHSKAELNSLAASINEKIVSRKAHLDHLKRQQAQLQAQCVENWGTDKLPALRKIYAESVAAQSTELNTFYQLLNEANQVLNQIDIELESIGSINAQ